MANPPSLIPSPSASSEPAPAPVPTPPSDALPAGTPEPSRSEAVPKFEIPVDRIPEKYRTAADPVGEFLKGYDNVNSLVGKSREEIAAAVKADIEKEQFAGRPETADKYELPQIDGVDAAQMAQSPLVGWWRETAHAKGLDQKGFEEGVTRYMSELRASAPNPETEMKLLGENAKPRLEAVGLWAKRTFQGEELDAAYEIATTAKGVQLLERLMRGQANVAGGASEVDGRQAGDDQATIDRLMASKEYYSVQHRDPKVVERVEAFFRKKHSA